MLSIHSLQTTHLGWTIQITQYENEFYFECYAPNLDSYGYSNDGELYSDVASAFAAAYDFVNREVAIQALITVANEWLEAGHVSEDEYWNLTDFA